MQIDYNNIQKYFDIVEFTDGKYICDKNRNIQASPSTYIICKLDMEYCDFWAITSNRSRVLDYFRNKYKNNHHE